MSLGFGFALPAYPLRGGGGNNPFNQTGPTLDLSFTGNAGNLSGTDTFTLDTNFITPEYQVAAQYAVWVDGSGMTQRNFADIVTFSRTSGATWFNSAGVNVGIDFSTSSVAIGTGSKTFTLTATAGVDRSWTAGDIVRISEQATPANFMDGTVTSYTASTQTLVVNVTATGGSGTIASWRVSNWMPRFDYDPATLLARGLLIEEQRANIVASSVYTANANGWTNGVIGGTGTIAAAAVNSPAGTTAGVFNISGLNGSSYVGVFPTVTASANARTGSVFVRNNGGVKFQIRLIFQTGGTFVSYGTEYDFTTTAFQDGIAGTTAPTSRSVTNVGNGWLRITITGSDNGTGNTQASLQFWGTATTTNYNYLMWGVQIEEAVAGASAAFPTSYIPTTVAQVTRNPDQASVNTLSPWYNQITGTVYAEFAPAFQGSATAAGNNPGVWGATQNGLGSFNGYGVRLFAQSNFSDNMNGVSRYAPSGFNTQVNIGPNAFLNLGQTYKTAFAWEASGIAASRDGQAVVTNTNPAAAAMGTHDQFYLGRQNIGGTPTQLNGYLRRITYYPRRLANADLQTITI